MRTPSTWSRSQPSSSSASSASAGATSAGGSTGRLSGDGGLELRRTEVRVDDPVDVPAELQAEPEVAFRGWTGSRGKLGGAEGRDFSASRMAVARSVALNGLGMKVMPSSRLAPPIAPSV